MSRSYDYIEVERPLHLPHTASLWMNTGVHGMSFQGFKDEKLEFCIGPTFGGIARRKVTFSEDEALKLPHDYHVAGRFDLDGQEVFVLLEK